MSTLFNSIISLYKNKHTEPRDQFSPQRYARHMINSVLIVVVVVILIASLIIIISLYEAFNGIF